MTDAIAGAKARVLADAGAALVGRVRDVLSVLPGGVHAAPWLRKGALRDSIGAQVDGDVLRVGSADPVAVAQENGTAHVPARPFLAPAGAALGAGIAAAVGAAIAAAAVAALRGDADV